jgi:hypothetical protein
MTDGDTKAFLMGIGIVLVVAAGVRALVGREGGEFNPFDHNPNRGFKSPAIFWFSVGWGFSLGIVAIGLAIFAVGK